MNGSAITIIDRNTSDHWSDNASELWSRISKHPFESPENDLDFLRRLMREQRWDRVYALRAIEEYRRFCFLLTIQSQALTPSEDVDQVWHLHLTYSRDYWDVWCKQVLQSPVHHGPTQGGIKLGHTFGSQYANTLAVYERYFEYSPEDLWPSSNLRFANAKRWRWIDESRYYIVPRPTLSIKLISVSMVGIAAALTTQPAIASTLNPLNWNAAPFLILYLAGMAYFAFRLIGRFSNDKNPHPNTRLDTPLTPVEAALLSDGEVRARHTVIAEALQNDVVRFSVDEQRLVKGQTSPKPHLQGVALAAENGGTVEQVDAHLKPLLEQATENLEKRGLLYPRHRPFQYTWRLSVLALAWTMLGVVRIFLGLERDEAIGFLLVLTLFQTILTILILMSPRWLPTTSGKWALAVTRKNHNRLCRAPRVENDELPMAVALMGTSVMITTPFSEYHSGAHPFNKSNSSSGAGGCSGSGDGGGGGGCGGCGGGG